MMIVVSTGLAVALTHDYFTWNRARWSAARQLMAEEKVEAWDIDCGYEFNGWYTYDPRFAGRPRKLHRYMNQKDDYRIDFTKQPGYRTVATSEFKRWLPAGTDPGQNH